MMFADIKLAREIWVGEEAEREREVYDFWGGVADQVLRRKPHVEGHATTCNES